MKRIRVKLGQRSYDIIIGHGTLNRLTRLLGAFSLSKVALVITNPTIYRLYGEKLKTLLAHAGYEVYCEEVPDSEESKSFAVCTRLVARCAELDGGRGIFIIALGGGVIGDLAGFCASIYHRGIPYVQIPTTLLAQVDSSIGGKVALDLACGKNLVGSFYQPLLVLSDIDFLASLEEKQIRNALAEIIKYGVIADRQLFCFLERSVDDILKRDRKKLQHIVEVCSRIKTRVVERDEYDNKGKRMTLNFGHTIGHALEAAYDYSAQLPHGFAIAIGMLVAGDIALRLGLVGESTLRRIETLIRKAGLPTQMSGVTIEKIIAAQAHDKKFNLGKNRFVLPVRIGKVIIKEGVAQKVIVNALHARMQRV
ncbi:MAG: 3-dehydroquinate synthase [Candidatus Omnitrophota bacterium]